MSTSFIHGSGHIPPVLPVHILDSEDFGFGHTQAITVVTITTNDNSEASYESQDS